jgi:predicted ArsR family transcriptional regulator
MEKSSAETVLADPIRRALFRLIAESERPLSRSEAADALALPKSTVTFHLDRMVNDGALTVSTRNTSERTGPGSGRPTSFYAPAQREVTLSVPPRQYELMGDILAAAVETTVGQSPALADALRATARRRGQELAASSNSTEGVLRENGFEPSIDSDGITLGNCPFHRLAREHTDVVCMLNGALLEGILEGAGDVHGVVTASPERSPCCARICWADGESATQ